MFWNGGMKPSLFGRMLAYYDASGRETLKLLVILLVTRILTFKRVVDRKYCLLNLGCFLALVDYANLYRNAT